MEVEGTCVALERRLGVVFDEEPHHHVLSRGKGRLGWEVHGHVMLYASFYFVGGRSNNKRNFHKALANIK